MDKEALRATLAADEDPGPGTVGDVVEGLFKWLAQRLPGTISAYLPMPGEVDVTLLFDRLPGWRWVLPRIERDRSMTFRDRDVTRETHLWGMEQPADSGEPIPIREIDVILAPGLAFDRGGARLGRGGGFYDRMLSSRRTDSDAIGVTVMSRVMEAVPMEPHDERVDWIATERGVIRCLPSL